MASSELMETCNFCGECCFVEGYGYCKYLLRVGKKTLCKIYTKRLGVKISPKHHCGLRSESKYDFVGCPHNSGKEIFKGVKT